MTLFLLQCSNTSEDCTKIVAFFTLISTKLTQVFKYFMAKIPAFKVIKLIFLVL